MWVKMRDYLVVAHTWSWLPTCPCSPCWAVTCSDTALAPCHTALSGQPEKKWDENHSKLLKGWRIPVQLVRPRASSGLAKDAFGCPSRRDGRTFCTCNCCSLSPSWKLINIWKKTFLSTEEICSLNLYNLTQTMRVMSAKLSGKLSFRCFRTIHTIWFGVRHRILVTVPRGPATLHEQTEGT